MLVASEWGSDGCEEAMKLEEEEKQEQKIFFAEVAFFSFYQSTVKYRRKEEDRYW